jgi:23S rRNA pseudouridine1911/1915/1917 synthase
MPRHTVKPVQENALLEIVYVVGSQYDGVRLDRFLMQHLRARSRAALVRSIHEGFIQIRSWRQALTSRPSRLLLPGDEVIVLCRQKTERAVSFDISVLFEDARLLVVNKPAHLPVHPAGGYYFHTLLTFLQSQRKRVLFLPHRIDKETSGVVILAKDKEACAHITQQFANRVVKKTYFAIVHGQTPPQFSCEAFLSKDEQSGIRLKMRADTNGAIAKTSFTTHYCICRQGSWFSAVAAFPETGRQHQIRVHLATLGFPIVGDKLYSIPQSGALEIFDKHVISEALQRQLILDRHALHAWKISFEHPETLEDVEFCAPIPAQLEAFLDPNFEPSFATVSSSK